MPTDADRAAFAEAKDICAERGWELHGWRIYKNFNGPDKPAWAKCDPLCPPYLTDDPYDTDIDATIAVMARGLRDEYSLSLERYKNGKWLILKHRVPFYLDGNKDGSFTSCWLRCEDSELAALVAACKEVGK